MRAKTSKSVQNKTVEDHYSFRSFAPPKPIFVQPKRITIKLAHFLPSFMTQTLAHQQAQVWPDSAPPGLLLFFPSPHTLMSPAFGHALQVDNSPFLPSMQHTFPLPTTWVISSCLAAPHGLMWFNCKCTILSNNIKDYRPTETEIANRY